MRDRLAKNRFCHPKQSSGLFVGEFIGTRQRMNGGREQRFVAVDVAEPGNDRLIEQQRLDLTPAREDRAERPRFELERLHAQRTEFAPDVPLIAGETPDPSESPRITETQLSRPVTDANPKMGVWQYLGIHRFYRQATAHTQMKDQLNGRFEINDHPFGPSPHVDDPPPANHPPQRTRIAVDDVPSQHANADHHLAGETPVKLAGDRFSFG